MTFAGRLLRWYDRRRRDLPWRRTRDPYRILVSEVMLQQTRVEAAIPYYEKFLERFPTAEALAAASEASVLACWSGLGYYARARNLQRAARLIASAGRFPADYDAIRALPGVGDYTAAAVASIALDLPHAALDGNVMRVVSRLSNDRGDIASAATRARFREFAAALLSRKNPGAFNQAMMELGATVCVPKSPDCPRCPVSGACLAHRNGTAAQLPVRRPRPEPVRLEATLAIVVRRGALLLRPPAAGPGRPAGLWDLPEAGELPVPRRVRPLGTVRHTITRHRYTLRVISASVSDIPDQYYFIPWGKLEEIPLSTRARKAINLLKLRA